MGNETLDHLLKRNSKQNEHCQFKKTKTLQNVYKVRASKNRNILNNNRKQQFDSF